MDKHSTDFDNWFSTLQIQLLDHGIDFTDEDAVRGDFDAGKNMFDVVDEIVAEYE